MTGQPSLFSPAEGAPSGFCYEEAFITEVEQKRLVSQLRELPWQPFQFGAYEGKRRVVSFGSRYDYARRAVENAPSPPDWLLPVIERVQEFGGPACGAIRQVLCTEYEKGAGIGWHRDKAYYGDVFGLSLVSECKFRFRRATSGGWMRFSLELQPRSLYMMSGESRHGWEHSISPVETIRYSITFRTSSAE